MNAACPAGKRPAGRHKLGRSDLAGLISGLPVVVIELKQPGMPARAAFDENLSRYQQQIPALFWFNALLIPWNGTKSRVGLLMADWERFSSLLLTAPMTGHAQISPLGGG